MQQGFEDTAVTPHILLPSLLLGELSAAEPNTGDPEKSGKFKIRAKKSADAPNKWQMAAIYLSPSAVTETLVCRCADAELLTFLPFCVNYARVGTGGRGNSPNKCGDLCMAAALHRCQLECRGQGHSGH